MFVSDVSISSPIKIYLLHVLLLALCDNLFVFLRRTGQIIVKFSCKLELFQKSNKLGALGVDSLMARIPSFKSACFSFNRLWFVLDVLCFLLVCC